MAEFMPHFARVVALFFLGTVLMIGASLLALFYGAVRRSSIPCNILEAMTLPCRVF